MIVPAKPRSKRMLAPLYTAEQWRRRNATVWTPVQGFLAIFQFLIFLVSLILVLRYVGSGEGLAAATWSVVAKTLILYTIMVTGSIWEKVVFDRYLFAPVFFWEDLVSMGVIALHTAYVLMWLANWGSPAVQMQVALAAYAAYTVNAAQFVLKLRRARLSMGGLPGQGAAA